MGKVAFEDLAREVTVAHKRHLAQDPRTAHLVHESGAPQQPVLRE